MKKYTAEYDSGHAANYQAWIGRYANSRFQYFARHRQGRTLDYSFNSQGYRGPEHHADPDITIFGSSFSFGVGLAFEQCWHQLLGAYRINCVAPAGFLVTNDDIIAHYHAVSPKSKVILQLREHRYDRGRITLPRDVMVFAVDETAWPDVLTFTWSSFLDKAEDGVHPGPKTHESWSQTIKTTFNL